MYIVKLDVNGNTCGNSTSPTSTIITPNPIVASPVPTLTTPTPTVTAPASLTSTGGTLTTICLTDLQPISNEIPVQYELLQNYPNPFNSTTTINFHLPVSNVVGLIIYNILGEEVTALVNEQLKPGTYEVEWDASNCPSGLYYYRLTARDHSETKKMVFLK